MAHNLRRFAVFGVSGLGAVAVSILGLTNGGYSEVRARNWHSNADMKYPASSNYPDLTKHNNYMADALTPAVSSTFI